MKKNKAEKNKRRCHCQEVVREASWRRQHLSSDPNWQEKEPYSTQGGFPSLERKKQTSEKCSGFP